MDITLVFFIYGLAFFCLGLAMLLESGRSPLLAEARVLRPLAIFGLVHGSHEWLEMFLDKSEWLVFQYPTQIAWLRIGVLTLSFVSLIIFGLQVLQPQRKLSQRDLVIWGTASGVYAMLVVLIGFSLWQNHTDRLSHIDAMARYLLAVPGAALASLALHRWATNEERQSRRTLGHSLRWAAWSFAIYALTQAVVPPLDVFPADTLNTANFTAWTGIPIQVVRAITAVVITIAMIRAIQLVEVERQEQFRAVQQARLDALAQVQQELVKRETMRQELLRHTVIAQEEERARIARELHDETAQTLTAFTLHLAALKKAAPEDPTVEDQVRQLQTLSQQVSEDIHRLVRDLHPAQLDDLGLVPALQYLADETHKHMDLKVHLEIDGERQRLDPLIETVCYRVAQEALTKVARHAGVAEACLQIQFQPQHVALRVIDQGSGFDPDEILSPPRGWGLAGMRERAESVGGELHLRPEPGEGTEVEVVIPINS